MIRRSHDTILCNAFLFMTIQNDDDATLSPIVLLKRQHNLKFEGDESNNLGQLFVTPEIISKKDDDRK